MNIKPYIKGRRISNLEKNDPFWVHETAANCFIKKGVIFSAHDGAVLFVPDKIEEKV